MTTPIGRILVALESTADAAAVLEEAVEVAEQHGARLVLLRTIHAVPMFAPSAVLATAQLVTTLEQSASDELSALASRAPAGMVDEALVRCGPLAETICRVAELANVDLIVMGATPTTGVWRRGGVTSTRVANCAPCRVLVVRDRTTRAA
jgi:nucleotide-binding universal stress UspA family protein